MNDLISRQDEIEAINKLWINGTSLCEADKLIEETINIPSANQWTPCSDRLPKKDGEYMVTYEKGYAEDYGLDLIGIAPFEVDLEGFGFWQEHYDMETLGYLDSTWEEIPVTAWMPKPKPWEGEEDG